MSLLPIFLSDCWDEFERPRSLLDRHYGLTFRPEDLFDSHASRNADILVCRPFRKFSRRFQPYETQENKPQGASVVSADKNKFHVTLDVQHFLPDEVSVKIVGNNVIVEGKHEEKEDEHGFVSRQFLRKYMVPSQCDVDQVRSSLSSDGILTITAPRKPVAALENRERVIEIQRTGKPALMENKAPGQPIGNKNTDSVTDKKEDQPAVEEGKKTIAAA